MKTETIEHKLWGITEQHTFSDNINNLLHKKITLPNGLSRVQLVDTKKDELLFETLFNGDSLRYRQYKNDLFVAYHNKKTGESYINKIEEYQDKRIDFQKYLTDTIKLAKK